MRVIAIMVLMMSSASAKDFVINDGDQKDIMQICDVAATSPAINREMRAALSQWCVTWEKRVQDANTGPPKTGITTNDHGNR